MTIMAFGKEWADKEKIKNVCAEIATLAESKAWKQLESLATSLEDLHKDKFVSMTDILSVRENAGIIAGIKKVIAIPEDCRQILLQDKQ